jgi:hypothetical protein
VSYRPRKLSGQHICAHERETRILPGKRRWTKGGTSPSLPLSIARTDANTLAARWRCSVVNLIFCRVKLVAERMGQARAGHRNF